MILLSFFVSIIYLLLIASFAFGFDKVSTFKLSDNAAKTTFSIIIPFRNEATHLPDLLKTIETLNYPKHLFEIIFIDDNSEDDSAEIIRKAINSNPFIKTAIRIIQNERTTNSPKKDAITLAIRNAKHDWIITTDADCQLPKFWLDSFDEYIQKNDTICVAAPVTYNGNTSLLSRFQTLDILSLQGATIGGFGIQKPFMCNGANLAYTKAIFNQVHGFEGNTNIASGDDIFLLEKIIQTHPNQLHYLKCEHAIVSTKPQPNWSELIAQRIRWASKTSAYNSRFGKLTGLIVLLMNLYIIIGITLSITGVLNLKTVFYILVIKFSIDFFLIYKSASFFNQKDILKSYIFGFLVYPFFSVYVAFISFFSSYTWKGRTFKK